MRLVLFVLSITFSACLFVWKTDMLADMDQKWQTMASNSASQTTPDGFADQMMAVAMAALGGGGPAAAALSVGATPSATGAPGMAGIPDASAIQSEIDKQLGGFSGGASGAGSFSRPKDFSARFVKAREFN